MKKLLPLILLFASCQKEAIQPAQMSARTILPTIQYIGRPSWGAYYAKTILNGTAHITVSDPGNYYYSIQNGTVTRHTKSFDVTGHGELIITQGKDYQYGFHATLQPAPFSPAPIGKLIEYIGDSITIGYTDSSPCADYAWLVSDLLGCEHIQTAYPGITLVKMSTQYFMTSPTGNVPYIPTYHPDLIVINLGTNDKESDQQFKDAYVSFINHLRQRYSGNIVLLRPFNGARAKVIKEVADMFGRVIYCDTNGWISRSDTNDGLHPSDAGHLKISKKLQPYINKYL
jgi:lysophospholipase L1-like esterase